MSFDAEQLTQLVYDVVEKFGYCLASDEDVEGFGKSESAYVQYSGPVSGVIEVSAELNLLNSLMINVVGEETMGSKQLRTEVLVELAMMIAGNWATKAHSKEIIDFSAPAEGCWGQFSDDIVELTLPFDEGNMRIRLGN